MQSKQSFLASLRGATGAAAIQCGARYSGLPRYARNDGYLLRDQKLPKGKEQGLDRLSPNGFLGAVGKRTQHLAS